MDTKIIYGKKITRAQFVQAAEFMQKNDSFIAEVASETPEYDRMPLPAETDAILVEQAILHAPISVTEFLGSVNLMGDFSNVPNIRFVEATLINGQFHMPNGKEINVAEFKGIAGKAKVLPMGTDGKFVFDGKSAEIEGIKKEDCKASQGSVEFVGKIPLQFDRIKIDKTDLGIAKNGITLKSLHGSSIEFNSNFKVDGSLVFALDQNGKALRFITSSNAQGDMNDIFKKKWEDLPDVLEMAKDTPFKFEAKYHGKVTAVEIFKAKTYFEKKLALRFGSAKTALAQ